MMRLPLAAVVASLPEPPPSSALEAARQAEVRAGWAESEAARARGQGLDGIADAHAARARGYRREALDALMEGGDQ